MPDAERVQSGMLVQTDATSVLADIGSGVLHRLVQYGFDFRNLDAVIVSHFHVDHCSDFMTLCQTLWLAGFERELKVYGPPPITEWTTLQFEDMFPYLAEKIGVETSVLDEDSSLRIGDLTITNAGTCHGSVDARALRFRDDERVVVFSSDTAPCRNLIELAKGADVLIHECNWLDGDRPLNVHTSPSELAKVAEEVAPGLLALNHVSPEVVNNEEEVLRIVSSETDARVMLSRDLMEL